MKKLIILDVISLVLFILYVTVSRLHINELKVYKDNVSVLLGDIEVKNTEIANSVAMVEALTLEKDGLIVENTRLDSICEELKIKKNKVERVVETKYSIVVDTVLQKVNDTVYVFKDDWIDLSVENNKNLKLKVREEVDVVEHYTKAKKFLFWEYGRKKYRTSVVFYNPYVEVVDISYKKSFD